MKWKYSMLYCYVVSCDDEMRAKARWNVVWTVRKRNFYDFPFLPMLIYWILYLHQSSTFSSFVTRIMSYFHLYHFKFKLFFFLLLLIQLSISFPTFFISTSIRSMSIASPSSHHSKNATNKIYSHIFLLVSHSLTHSLCLSTSFFPK